MNLYLIEKNIKINFKFFKNEEDFIMFISILFTVALLLTIILPVIGYFVGEQTKVVLREQLLEML